MVLNYIDRLRKRPEAERKKIVLFTAGVATGIIGLFWLTTFNVNELTTDSPTETAVSSSPLGDVKSTASVLFADFKSEWKALKERFAGDEFSEFLTEEMSEEESLPADQGQ